MIGLVDAFSTSYAQARVKFLEGAATASLQIESFNQTATGKEGEVLALDAVLQAPQRLATAKAKGHHVADKLLIVSSAANGASPAAFSASTTSESLTDSGWAGYATAFLSVPGME